MNQQEIERAIFAAHEAGDRSRLATLQERFRNAGYVVDRPAPPPQLIERGRVTTGGRPRDRARVDPEVVAINSSALAAITTFNYDVDEAGGYLFGVFGKSAALIDYSAKSETQDRSPNHIRLSHAESRRLEAAFGRPCVGDWHTHPNGGLEPSVDDRRDWANNAKQTGAPWVGIIVTDDYSQAYITDMSGRTRAVDTIEED
jgi:proteasome lid subunit RPN8/RPN11